MLIPSLLACISPVLAVWIGYSYRQNRSLKQALAIRDQKLGLLQEQQDHLTQQIKTDTGCNSVRELLLMYSRVLRVLPSSLGRFYEYSRPQYTTAPEIRRQVALVGFVLRGMQETHSRFRPVMETVVVDQLQFATELKEEFPDLLPLLEGLTFAQMVGLALSVIDWGGTDIPEALRKIGFDEEHVKRARQQLASFNAS